AGCHDRRARRAGAAGRARPRHARLARARVARHPDRHPEGPRGTLLGFPSHKEPAMIDEASLKLLFTEARTQNGWLATPVSDAELGRIYDIVKMGPTSTNSCPARFVFLRTPEAKARVLPALSPGNVEKTKQAPVTAIIGYDTRFFEWQPRKLFTHRPELAEN